METGNDYDFFHYNEPKKYGKCHYEFYFPFIWCIWKYSEENNNNNNLS